MSFLVFQLLSIRFSAAEVADAQKTEENHHITVPAPTDTRDRSRHNRRPSGSRYEEEAEKEYQS
jgi:hypothetical protein